MWAQLATALSFIFPFAIFAIILILHSWGFDPDTRDVPKHLRSLKALAWSLAGLCIYYNAGEIQEPVRGHMTNIIFILTCVLITGLWYVFELPAWYRQLSEDQRQIWQGDPNPEEPQNRGDAERILGNQANQDSEARRDIWKLQQRGRFPQLPNEDQRPNFTYEERALSCGYAAYNYVEAQKDLRRRGEIEGLEFREVIWWVDPDDRTLRSHSEFTDQALRDPMPEVAGVDRFRENPSALFMTCVSVDNPAQIMPAINLIQQTLERVSYYDKYEGEVSRTQFKYSVAVDCEFRTITPENPQGPRDDDNHVVSCMTVCIDKILAVNFHIYHMITSAGDLATANATVEGIENLFLNLILEPHIIKIWFNYQNDIQVMDATLDEIYRGTPRRTFKIFTFGEGWSDRTNPPYKLTLNLDQDTAFSGERPQNLTFHKIRGSEWGTACPYGFHRNSVDKFGRPCPCRTNNLDLAVVTEFIIRDLHMGDPRAGGLARRSWTDVRYRGSYARFENCMLLGDKHEELFGILKDTGANRAHPQPVYPVDCLADCRINRCLVGCPNFQIQQDHETAVQEFKREFFENFSSPRFQENPALLGYAIGDVVGLALVARFIMTTEKPRLLAERLRLWSNLPTDNALPAARFGRPMAGVNGYGSMADDREQEAHYRLIRAVPFTMEHPPLEKRDMIGWEIGGDQHIRQILGRDTRWRIIEPDSLYNIVWQFLKTNPMLFGDFLFSYSRKQYGLPRGQVDGNQFRERSTFSKEAIETIFQQESFYDICLGLLPMLISQLELMLLDELTRDNEIVIRMVQQYDEQRRGYGAFANEMDNRRLLDAKEVLSKIHNDPAWKPRGNIGQIDAYPVTRWILQPLQKFTTFPDRYELGYRLLGGLINEFRTLESTGRRRREQFTSKLRGLTGEGEIARLSEAAFAGVRSYADTDSESKWILRDEQRDIRGRIENFIAFWIRLFFNTPVVAVRDDTNPQMIEFVVDEVTVDGTRPAEKVYDLMFSPTNFYMPEFINARPTREMATDLPMLPVITGQIAPPFERDDEDIVAPVAGGGVVGGWDDDGVPPIPVAGEWGVLPIPGGDVARGWDDDGVPPIPVAGEWGALPIPGGDVARGWDDDGVPPVPDGGVVGWWANAGGVVPAPNNGTRIPERTPRELQFARFFARWAERILGPADTWEAFPG